MFFFLINGSIVFEITASIVFEINALQCYTQCYTLVDTTHKLMIHLLLLRIFGDN